MNTKTLVKIALSALLLTSINSTQVTLEPVEASPTEFQRCLQMIKTVNSEIPGVIAHPFNTMNKIILLGHVDEAIADCLYGISHAGLNQNCKTALSNLISEAKTDAADLRNHPCSAGFVKIMIDLKKNFYAASEACTFGTESSN